MVVRVFVMSGLFLLPGLSHGQPLVNCLGSGPCAQILVSGSPYSPTKFSGNADPTMRQDPLTGQFWMAYSWPHILSDGSDVVDTHVAYYSSSAAACGGITTGCWTNYMLAGNGVLYQSQTVTNPVTMASNNHTSNEVMELYPFACNVGGTTYTCWAGIHQQYWVCSGCAAGSQNYTVRQMLVGCHDTTGQGPMCLASQTLTPSGAPTANVQWLGGSDDEAYPTGCFGASCYWPIAYDLPSMSGGACQSGNIREPTFLMGGSTLYLFVNCADMSDYLQFETTGAAGASDVPGCLEAGTCSWRFDGSFATQNDANRICAKVPSLSCSSFNNFLTQSEIAIAAGGGIPGLPAGSVIELFDVAHLVNGSKVSSGIVVTALKTVSPPSFVRNPDGSPTVYAVILSTDSVNAGIGSSTYAPNGPTGIVVAHRIMSCANSGPVVPGCDAQGGQYTYLVDTGLQP